MSRRKNDISKPPRPDKGYLDSMVKTVITSRITIAGSIAIILFLCVIILSLIQRKKIICIVEKETGKTYSTISTGLTKDIVENQVKYYSMQFCEDLYSMDWADIRESRKEACDLMTESLYEKLGGKGIIENKNVLNAIKARYNSVIEWNMRPQITMSNDPKYRSFCQFERTIMLKGYKPQVKTFSVRLDWYRKDTNPYKRPHSLYLTDMKVLEKGTKEYNEQINKLN